MMRAFWVGMNNGIVRMTVLALGLACSGACDTHLGGGTVGGAPEVDQVQLSIEVVPEDVVCVRVSAAAADGRQIARELGVEPGKTVELAWNGLPTGAVTFAAEAFGKPCSEVTAASVGTWVSEPVVASISTTKTTSVSLTMHRNGRAKLEVGFAAEPVCAAAGIACKAAADCCSHSCKKSVCEGSRDAGADGG